MILGCFMFFLLGVSSFQNYKIEKKLKTNEKHVGVLTIDDVLKSNKFQNRYLGEIITTDGIKQKIIVYQDSKLTPLQIGNRIVSSFHLEEINTSKNPFQFNYANYLHNKNIFVQAKIPLQYKFLENAQGFTFQVIYFRSKLLESFKIHHFSKDVNAVIYSLLFGMKNDLSEQIQTDYKNAGVMHVLAVSGMHIGIIYFLINLILKWFIRSENARFGITIAILCIFAVLSGLSGSVVRSVVMFLIIGLSVVFKRKTDSTHALIVSMFFILNINPSYFFDVGFQLSYLAVFSIIYLYPLIRNVFTSKNIILNYFLELIGISLVAQIGILPLTIFYFGQVPLLFLIGNIIVVPLLTVVLFGLIALLLLNFIWKFAALYLGDFLSFLIEWVNNLIAIVASKEDFVLNDIKMSLLQSVLSLVLIFLIAHAIKQFTFKKIFLVFILVITIQMSYFQEAIKMNSIGKEMFLYDYNSTTFVALKNRKLTILSNDTLVNNKNYIKNICKEYEVEKCEVSSIKNYFETKNFRCLIVDSLGVVNVSEKIDVLILKDNSKFNLDRYLLMNKPKLVIIHPKNYKKLASQWQESCAKKKIPFHDMREKGFVDFGQYNL